MLDSPRTQVVPRFVVVELDSRDGVTPPEDLAREIAEWVGSRMSSSRAVEVWRSRWASLADGAGSMAAISGACSHLLPCTPGSVLQGELRASAIAFRSRYGGLRRRSGAELNAVASGWPVRYV
jgi:hypothetical protein